MTLIAPQIRTDPLRSFIAGAFIAGTPRPIPLIATGFDVDIYGRSGLSSSDDLIHGGPVQMADLSVECRDGTVTLAGARLENGCTKVPLNAPIDLAVNGTASRDLLGRAADGREVVLRVTPA